MTELSPEIKAHLELFNQGPALESMEPKKIREMLLPILSPLSKVEDRYIPVKENEKIKVRIYTPEGTGPFPIIVFFHGGGWVIGDLETNDDACRMLANNTKRIVVSVDYRLAPEYKFPTPLNDSYAAFLWSHENASSFNGDSSNIVVSGDSAGGNLAAAISIMARDQKGPKITAQVLLYPVTNMKTDTESYNKYQQGFGLDKSLMHWFIDHYIQKEEDKSNEYVAPLLAKDLSMLPPAIIITAENDVLRDEGLAYAERLKKAKVDVEYICEEGLIHGYFTYMDVFSDRVEQSISKINSFLNKS